MPEQDLLFFETSGFSMWPFIRPKEKLLIKKIPVDDLRPGDIILYRANNQLACHRLVKKNRDFLWTRGDNSISSPEMITKEMFIGKVVGIIKNNKMISLTGWRSRLINSFMVIIAPLIIRFLKPIYMKLHKR
ncbi:MAG: S24/S26 family peptidase [Candidatus Omnitrophica bacterium]|nr:S24/S26 family peptidase [Candidatus Omnitrophota bacterium]MBU4468537.1 S24/S26 family peptidase [Candidatus Omnitrophota bacterium]MCG2707752.1 S24/S26 family peptidase [Candidatus Omnitrophota bacterium]